MPTRPSARSDASTAVLPPTSVRLTEHLAADTKPYGISVFAILPGLVYTELAAGVLETPEGRQWTPQYREVYAERHVPAEQAGQLCAFLASGQADGLSGRLLSVADDVASLVSRVGEIQRDDLYTLRLRT